MLRVLFSVAYISDPPELPVAVAFVDTTNEYQSCSTPVTVFVVFNCATGMPLTSDATPEIITIELSG